MAIGDISALAPISVTLATAAAVVATVPANEEWTLRLIRAVNLTGANATISAGLSASFNELCFNEMITAPTASAKGARNIIGPDFLTIPPGTEIRARASVANAIRLLMTGTKKQVA